MLGTLLDGADDAQRSPRLGEALDLLGNAVRMRLARGSRIGGVDEHWAPAARVFGFAGAALLAALMSAVPLSLLAAEARDLGYIAIGREAVQWQELAIAAVWMAAAVSAMLPTRAPAVTLSWLTAASYLAWSFQNSLTENWPMVVLSILVAASLSRDSRPIQRVVGWPLTLLTLLTALAIASALWVDVWLMWIRPGEDGYPAASFFGFGLQLPTSSPIWVGLYPVAVYLLSLVMFAVLLANVGKPVRRRVISLCLIPVTMFFVVRFFYGQPVGIVDGFIPQVPTAEQWLLLILLPPALFAAAFLAFRVHQTRDQ